MTPRAWVSKTRHFILIGNHSLAGDARDCSTVRLWTRKYEDIAS